VVKERRLMLALSAVLRRYWPVVVATAVLVPHVLLFDFVSDDAYISFRYARNLAEHGQLVFNLGERVEGYTNFLWTVLLAGGIKLGVSPVLSSRVLGLVFGILTLAVAVRLSLTLDRDRPSRWHLVAPLGLAVTGAFACWCSGGLETQLFTFLVFLAFERLIAEVAEGTGATSAVCFALAAMTRPEGMLLFGAAVLFRWIVTVTREWRFLPRRHEVIWAAIFVVLFLPYYAWRWRYYGWPFPNTFYVKTSGGPGTWLLGAYYLRRFAEDYGVFFLVLLGVCAWPLRGDRRRRSLFVLTAIVWAVYAIYVVSVGGDFMGLYRFILPALPIAAVTLQESLRALWNKLEPFAGKPALALAGAMLAGGFLAGSAKVSHGAATIQGADNGIDTPAFLKQYALDRIALGYWFRQNGRPGDLMTVGGAGVIPYYSNLRAFDVFGLVDERVAHDKSMTHSTRPGHEKWASDTYVLSRRPRFITHYYCIAVPCADEQRRSFPGYQWMRISVPGPSGPLYYSFLNRLSP
jgi:arabinofuranosyltransferase